MGVAEILTIALSALGIAGATIGSCVFFFRLTREQIGKLEDLQSSMAQENKDFHGRLCVLEERYIQMMQRFLEKS